MSWSVVAEKVEGTRNCALVSASFEIVQPCVHLSWYQCSIRLLDCWIVGLDDCVQKLKACSSIVHLDRFLSCALLQSWQTSASSDWSHDW